MKHLPTLLVALSLFSCKHEEKTETVYQQASDAAVAEGDVANLSPEAKLGQEIFDGKGNCYSCHKPDQKVMAQAFRKLQTSTKQKRAIWLAF